MTLNVVVTYAVNWCKRSCYQRWEGMLSIMSPDSINLSDMHWIGSIWSNFLSLGFYRRKCKCGLAYGMANNGRATYLPGNSTPRLWITYCIFSPIIQQFELDIFYSLNSFGRIDCCFRSVHLNFGSHIADNVVNCHIIIRLEWDPEAQFFECEDNCHSN